MVFNINQQLADELNLKVGQVKQTIKLLDQDNTIPFIARYRKEMTGNLDEQQLRKIDDRLEYLRNLQDRKEQVISLINKQDKLTSELEKKIIQATKLQTVEDLYRPYKQKRKTRAAKAKEKGLEPLSKIFLEQKSKFASIEEVTKKYLNPKKGIKNIDQVLQGVNDIIAEYIADHPISRKIARKITFEQGKLVSQAKTKTKTKSEYEIYYDYQQSINKIPPYRVLAINRGENEDLLKVKINVREENIINRLANNFILEESIFKPYIQRAIDDAYHRLIAPAIEREIRTHLTNQAEEHAINVFATNLRNLLLQPPLTNHKVLAIDPAFRTGCKVVVLDELGDLLINTTIYPHAPQNEKDKAKQTIIELIKEYNLNLIAIGNGTACRETEVLISEIIKDLDQKLKYIIVNEAGASVYSASSIALEEFPNLDVSMRGAISIGRRLQDPLAELVKINPKHIGVGMYQHDISESKLEKSLENVVESVVNYVGVDVNTASSSLLEYIAGIKSNVAKNIVEYRQDNNKITSLQELKNVYRLGPKTFTQSAGFLKIRDANNPLDGTTIHPESYEVAEQVIKRFGFELQDLLDKEQLKKLEKELKRVDLSQLVKEIKLNVGLPTLKDIVSNLIKPDRDPREDVPKPVFRTDVLKIKDLQPGMILKGTVRNVVDFGAFVDVGVKQDGLIHISELSSEYVTDPLEVITVGEIVKVKILDVDIDKERISLTMNF